MNPTAGTSFAAPIVELLAPGYGEIPGKSELTVLLTRVMMPFLAFASFAAVAMGVLNAEGRFGAPAFAPAMFNVVSVSVGALLWLAGADPRAVAIGWAVGTILGGLAQLLVQWPALRSSGFRVGWVLAPHAVREKLVLAQESATLCPPAFSQLAVSSYLTSHDWLGQIKQFREMYRERRDAMVGALDDLMPATARWNVPHGGFYVWLTLPDGLDAKAMLPRAVTARVAYVPGTAFFADGFGSGSMRLSFCYPTPERIREGVRRLAGVLDEEMELRETFGATPAHGSHAPHGAHGDHPGLPRSGYDGPGTDLS